MNRVMDGELPPQVVGQIFLDVLLVLTRQDDSRDAGAARRQDLLLDAADGEHPARQRDLAGHGDVAAHRPAGQLRHQRGDHRDARRGPVLGHGAGRDVHVDLGVLVEGGIDAVALRVRAEPRERGRAPDSFITSPSWPVSVRLPPPGIRVASMNSTSPPAGVHARPMATPGSFVRSAISSSRNVGRAEDLDDHFRRDGHLASSPRRGGAPLCGRGADLALEIPHAGFARVVADHGANAASLNLICSARQSVLDDLLRDQVLDARSSSFSSSV